MLPEVNFAAAVAVPNLLSPAEMCLAPVPWPSCSWLAVWVGGLAVDQSGQEPPFPSCKGCWDHANPSLPVHTGRLTLPLPLPLKTFKIENFSSLGRRGHQMMDNQKEWQKPPNPETEEKIGGHSSQPWRHVDQMFPATRWWLWFLI